MTNLTTEWPHVENVTLPHVGETKHDTAGPWWTNMSHDLTLHTLA